MILLRINLVVLWVFRLSIKQNYLGYQIDFWICKNWGLTSSELTLIWGSSSQCFWRKSCVAIDTTMLYITLTLNWKCKESNQVFLYYSFKHMSNFFFLHNLFEKRYLLISLTLWVMAHSLSQWLLNLKKWKQEWHMLYCV